MPLAWTVLIAVLFSIALPSLTTLGTDGSPVMTEICTSSGMKNMAVPVSETGASAPANQLHDGHCQLCPVGAAASPVPDITVALPIAVRPSHESVPAPPAPLAQRKCCSPPPSQAPPVFP